MKITQSVALLVLLASLAGTAVAGGIYLDNGDGTVRDAVSSVARPGTPKYLTWTKDANLPGKILSYSEAVQFVEEMNIVDPNFQTEV